MIADVLGGSEGPQNHYINVLISTEKARSARKEDSIILEEAIDADYEPTEEEVAEYADWLGMDVLKDTDLFWIAREGLCAPLPEHWKPCKTTDTDEIYYFNFSTGDSIWDHPCDEHYRKLTKQHKERKLAQAESGGRSPDGSPARPQPQSDQFMRVWGDL